MDLISTYFPNLEEIPDEVVNDARARLVVYWRRGWPDLDMRPGSPFGDSIVTPLAYILAAAEISMDRFRSDLDLEQVAKGTIFDCDFVEKYLKNFAIYPREGLPATGIVRFIFNVDQDLEIDRGIKLQFGGTEDNVFYPRLVSPGPILIKKVGSLRESGANVFPLIYLSDTQFAADIPVYGQMTTPVLSGDEAEINTTIDNLSGLVAIVDFAAGKEPESLPALAARTRKTFYSASMNQRGSVAHFLLKEYPDLIITSPVLPGDWEMMRGSTNALGFSTSVMDVYVRSQHFQRQESHTIRLEYVAEQDSTEVDCYIGKLNLAGTPMSIDSIVAVDNPEVLLDDGAGSQLILSRSRDPKWAPLLTAGFTTKEELWLVIKMPRSTSGNQLIVPHVDSDGKQYSDFTITYRTDPLLEHVSDYLESPDVKPVGVNPLIRGVLPINLTSLTVRYTRHPGTNVMLEQAREEIYNYLFKNGYPDRYTDAKIGDSMFYAGASTVVGIDCVGRLRWSVADRVLPVSSPDPDVDLATALAESITAPNLVTYSSNDFNFHFRDPYVGTPDATYVSAGYRNIGIMIRRENIYFKEVK